MPLSSYVTRRSIPARQMGAADSSDKASASNAAAPARSRRGPAAVNVSARMAFVRRDDPAALRILLIEDDEMLGDAVGEALRQESYVVDWVRTAGAALAALSTSNFSALVLDLGLPDGDGLSVLRWLRQNGRATPVVIVTARDRVSERIGGLDAGADDYLIKPFDIDELGARLRAITRRADGCVESVLIAGDVALDLRQRTVTCQGAPAPLTAREYAVVELLM